MKLKLLQHLKSLRPSFLDICSITWHYNNTLMYADSVLVMDRALLDKKGWMPLNKWKPNTINWNKITKY